MSTASQLPPDDPASKRPPRGFSHRIWYQSLSAINQPKNDPAPAVSGSGEDIMDAQPPESPARPARRFSFLPAFWTVTGVLSLIVNIILIIVIFGLASQIFTLKALVQNQLIDGLRQNFALMDQSRIKTTIPVKADVPAKFNLPLKTETAVTLTKETTIRRAKVSSLTTGGLVITNAPADIVLPAGTILPIALDLTVPVDQMIPVNLSVNVDIPLNQTDLHKPFTGLQKVVDPYYNLLDDLPGSWQEVFCGKKPDAFCKALFPK